MKLPSALSLALVLAACDPPSHPRTLRQLYDVAPLRSIERPTAALVLVDFQREFLDGALPLPDVRAAVERTRALLAWARRDGITVIHVRNVVPRPSAAFEAGTAGAAFIDAVAPHPGELVVTKWTGGGFTGTALESLLKQRGIDTIVVAGLMTHLAVQVTASDAATRGFHVIVASDATASRDLPGSEPGRVIDHRIVHEVALAAIADRFAEVLSSNQIFTLARR